MYVMHNHTIFDNGISAQLLENAPTRLKGLKISKRNGDM